MNGYENKEKNYGALKALGWASLAIGVAAVSLLVGRQLRNRAKYSKRTPYDYYAHAGDAAPTEYGMGV
jgi:hypothetical protein